MRASLPFTRAAILSPELAFSQPHSPFTRQTEAELRRWWAVAQDRGADAAYPRVTGYTDAEAILQTLIGIGASILAPAAFQDTGIQPLAWHYMGAEFKAIQALSPVTGALRGCSAHSIADLQAAEALGFDYAFLSPIFPTQTHPDATALGLAHLQDACTAVKLPIIALGGVDFKNAAACLQAGAAGWAGIRCWM